MQINRVDPAANLTMHRELCCITNATDRDIGDFTISQDYIVCEVLLLYIATLE